MTWAVITPVAAGTVWTELVEVVGTLLALVPVIWAAAVPVPVVVVPAAVDVPIPN